MKNGFLLALIMIICANSAFSISISRSERIEAAKVYEIVSDTTPRLRPATVSVPYFEDFEAGDGGWTTSAFGPLCQWQRMTNPELIFVHSDIYGTMIDLGDPRPAYLPFSHSGNSCFWYGNPENGSFIGEPFDHSPFGGPEFTGGNSEDEHGGRLISPLLETDELAHISFSFWTWWEVECIDIDAFDMMYILISTDTGVSWDTLNWLNPPFSRLPGWDHWEGYSSGGYLEPGVWIKWTYFLDPEYSGHNIILQFLFSTEDPLYNGFRGWFIYDLYDSCGLEEAQLIRRPEYPNPLGVVDCHLDPNPFPHEFIIENIGGEAAEEVFLTIDLPTELDLSFGMPSVPLGTMAPGEKDTVYWEIEVLDPPLEDTSYCWHVVVTSADSLIGYHDNFEGDEPLFIGDENFDYCDVRLPFGPESAVTGFGVVGIPSDGSDEYPSHVYSVLTSEYFYLSSWVEAYIAFWYWLSVPQIDPSGWSRDGEDGFLVEIEINHGSWTQLDEYGVGLLLPRYDAYIDEWVDNPIANRMAYCDSSGRWIEVVSQNLIGMGVLNTDDTVRIRFVFGSTSFDNREGFFLDEFRLSTVQYPIGPFLHTLCVDVSGTHTPNATLVTPADSSSSSCERQEIVINVGGESIVDSSRVVIWVDNTNHFTVNEGNLSVDASMGAVIAQFPVGQTWLEGWHNARLDTCYNILGCNLDSPLVFDFLIDLTPPVASLTDPSGGVFYGSNDLPIVIGLEDTLTGVDSASIQVVFCGNSFNIGHAAVGWDGSEIIFSPLLTGTGNTWIDCPEVCIIAADSPDYCEPNIDTTCFEISVVYSPPTAELVVPNINDITSCDDQQIVIALFDSIGIEDSGAVMILNEREYTTGIDTELEITNDTLYFTPSVNWWHNQTVEGSLVEFYNIHGTRNIDTTDFSFMVDLESPIVQPLVPVVGTITSDEYQITQFSLEDYPAGLDLSTLQIICDGRVIDFEDGIWLSSENGGIFEIRPSEIGFSFTPGDTVDMHVYICDDPDLCSPNCTTTVWRFVVEPKTSCIAEPNPFTPNGDNVNDIVLFDYPHSYTRTAQLTIYNLENIEVYHYELNGSFAWDGRDAQGKMLKQGLYLYLLINEARVVCNGTVLLLR
ncbi:gliding motility-associated C-terminal domain-containing protein [bacterium]|nr:gliding motility-associated C-terminal domain-containing protein [bacterium]